MTERHDNLSSPDENKYTVQPGLVRTRIYLLLPDNNTELQEVESKLSFDLSKVGSLFLSIINFLSGDTIPPGWEHVGRYIRPRSRTAELLRYQAADKNLSEIVEKHYRP